MHKYNVKKIIENMAEDEEELSEQTKKDIEKARKQVSAGKFYTHEEIKNILWPDRKRKKERALWQLKQIKKLVDVKDKDLRLAAEWTEPWKSLISTILSSQTRDDTTLMISNILYKKYPTLKRLAGAELSAIRRIIRPVNFYKTKSKHILETAKILVNTYRCKIPKTREELMELPGVGRKVANVYLATQGFDEVGVDTHLTYCSRRLGWSKQKNPHKIEEDLRKLFPRKYWRSLNYIIVRFGRIYNRNEQNNILDKIRRI